VRTLSLALTLALLPGLAAAAVVPGVTPEGARSVGAPGPPRGDGHRADEAQAPVQARPGGPETEAPRTDQTLDVPKGTRLLLNNQAGEVRVRTWDRDQVRVQASHSPREQIDARVEEQALRIRARAVQGARSSRGLIDYVLTVPRWMPVNLSGSYLEADVEGTTAEINVETVGGNIRVVGGSGTVSARSVEGTIAVERTTGKVTVSTVNDGIDLVGVAGDVTAETVNGDITLRDLAPTTLEVSTVNGDVTWSGSTVDRGTARIATHSGDIRVSVGQAGNATVFVRTFGGDFSADFPITLPEGMDGRDGHKRFNFTLGGGAARVELQSFNGDVHVAKGAVAETKPGRRPRIIRGPLLVPPPPAPPAPPAVPVPGAKPKPKGGGDDGDALAESIADDMLRQTIDTGAMEEALHAAREAMRTLDVDRTALDAMRSALDEVRAQRRKQ
jgi:hypothetical protein